MDKKYMKIAIIGAGPAGLACALECERLGVIPDLFDTEESVGWVWLYIRNGQKVFPIY